MRRDAIFITRVFYPVFARRAGVGRPQRPPTYPFNIHYGSGV